MINIAGLTAVDDPSYRYKMPRLIPKVEGRGNGIKTVIVNVSDIATSLNRDPSEITKFFGFELGAQTTMNVDEDRYIVNGAHSMNDLQHLVHKYIELFVLCKNCHLPETHYKIKGGGISQKCVACGSKDLCDMTHKLTTFISKQHKKMKEGAAAASSSGGGGEEGGTGSKKKDKKEKKSKSGGGGEESTSATAAAAFGGEDGEEGIKKKEKKSKKKKVVEEEEEVAVEALEGDTEREALESAIDQFRLWLSAHSEYQEAFQSNTPLKSQKLTQLLEELRSTQTLSSLPTAYRYFILLGALFTSQCLVDNEVSRYKDILNSLLQRQNRIQQRQFISAMEWFVGVRSAEAATAAAVGAVRSSLSVRTFPVVLKQLYDEDLLEEETLLEWYGDELKNEYTADATIISTEVLETLKEAAKPFIVWLEEADEEGDDEEEEEEEEN